MKEYIYGQTGQELTVVDGNQNLVAGETYLGGRYLGTQQASTGAFAWAEGDGLGTVRARTSVPCGGNCETYTSDPWGSNLSQVGAISNLHFTGKYRDGEDNLDYFGARYYNAWLGRFMTPDWSDAPDPIPHADLTDPQSLNLFSYVENNPATMVDPDGLDFNLACNGTTGCQGGIQGTFQYSTDANGNTTSQFTPTVITSASLSDPNSGDTATLNQDGVQITVNGHTSEGIFINNTRSADINGSGELAGINFHIDSSDVKTGTLDAGTFTFQGVTGEVALTSKLNAKGAFTYPGENVNVIGNPFHKGDLNFRFSSGADPDVFDYGPSPHLLVPKGDKGSSGSFHIDSHTGFARRGACAWFHLGC